MAQTILIVTLFLTQIFLSYLLIRSVRVNIFLRKMILKVREASLIKLYYYEENNINGFVDLFQTIPMPNQFELTAKYPFRKLELENILEKKDFDDLNKWLNTSVNDVMIKK